MELLHFKRLLNLHLLPWQEPKYQSFWNFYSLFKRQGFGVSEILGLPPVRAVGQIFQDQLAHLEGEAGRTREFGDEHDPVSLWFVWVRFGSRSVNEPEIGSVSVCIPTVCFVESKLIDANCLHMSEFNPEKLCSEMKGTSGGLNQDVGSSSTPKSEVQR